MESFNWGRCFFAKTVCFLKKFAGLRMPCIHPLGTDEIAIALHPSIVAVRMVPSVKILDQNLIELKLSGTITVAYKAPF
jgi:hypothetical protein